MGSFVAISLKIKQKVLYKTDEPSRARYDDSRRSMLKILLLRTRAEYVPVVVVVVLTIILSESF